MRYNKQPTDITTQLAMLKQRGLIINDEGMALKQLASISYFRLASYWKVFEIDETTHQFASGTRIEDVISLYTFDRELRSIIFTAIQDIEVALRTRIIHFFSLSHGAFWFMQLLCSSWSCMEPPLSSHASATKATASYMGRYPAHTTDEIICTVMYPALS